MAVCVWGEGVGCLDVCVVRVCKGGLGVCLHMYARECVFLWGAGSWLSFGLEGV